MNSQENVHLTPDQAELAEQIPLSVEETFSALTAIEEEALAERRKVGNERDYYGRVHEEYRQHLGGTGEWASVKQPYIKARLKDFEAGIATAGEKDTDAAATQYATTLVSQALYPNHQKVRLSSHTLELLDAQRVQAETRAEGKTNGPDVFAAKAAAEAVRIARSLMTEPDKARELITKAAAA